MGALSGGFGGLTMAIWSMVLLGLTGLGFWAPLNLIAHTVWHEAPLDGTFSLPALLIGMAVHTMMAMLFGTMITMVAQRLRAVRSVVIAAGTVLSALVWAVMRYGVWRAADPVASAAFTPWVLAVAHLMFGMIAATMAGLVVEDELTPTSGASSSPSRP